MQRDLGLRFSIGGNLNFLTNGLLVNYHVTGKSKLSETHYDYQYESGLQ